MLSTRFTELVGSAVPIQVAPMGQVSSPELVAAANAAGAHAMLGLTGFPAAAAGVVIERTKSLGASSFGANFLVPFVDRDVVEFVASRVGLVDFYLGPPTRELVDIVHGQGALAGWQITSLAQAVAADEAGCDLVIAHGIEAGGRNPGGIGLITLLAQVLDTVGIPVIAAGGISTGRGVAGALAMGADGVRLGTRFVAAAESGAHPDYVAALLRADSEQSIRTDTFHVDFPAHLSGSRVLRTAVDAVEGTDEEIVGEMILDGDAVSVVRSAAFPPTKNMTGNIAAMALYAGESVWAVRDVRPAAEIIAELMDGAEALLSRQRNAT